MRRLLIALVLMASQAHAENWQQVANLDSKGGILFVDTASIDRDSEPRKAWFKSVYPSDRPIADGYRGVAAGAQSFRWESSLGHFNCAQRTLAMSQSVLYAADGRVVGNVEIDSSALQFREVAPQSIGGLMLTAVCGPSTSDELSTVGLARVKTVANPDNFYPSGAKSRGEQGSPIVKVCVGPTGTPLREPELTGTSGFPDLDAAAIKVAKAMRFAAAVQDGKALPESCIKFAVRFARH